MLEDSVGIERNYLRAHKLQEADVAVIASRYLDSG